MEKNILTPEAKAFLSDLHRKFNPKRLRLLEMRKERQERLDRGEIPSFPEATRPLREDLSWKVQSPPKDLQVRTVEITGPVERKMMINALNSGADLFMADFEDALSPTWENVIQGQQNLIDAVRGTIQFKSAEGKEYKLNEKTATLAVRPRGWHLPEKHFMVDGEPISGSIFDFGLYLFHNAHALIEKGSGPYYYIAKLENHHEAALWSELFVYAEELLKLPRRSIKVTVLIETILAAFEMEEILYSLKDYIVGLNAGRWDYIFSIIKKFSHKRDFLFPDRAEITMGTPFMESYAARLVEVCRKRRAQPIGGMSAFIPSRKDAELNAKAMAKVTEDKQREAAQGFIGAWVAHPDLVSVVRDAFNSATPLKEAPISAKELLNFTIPNGKITEEGVKQNVEVFLEYLEAWLSGQGAVAIHNLMEDAATAEISRAQLWQWVHHGAISMETVSEWIKKGNKKRAGELLEKLTQSEAFVPFFTLEAYKQL
jgi:malate synthase